jgi:hypothetical protein
LVKSFCSRDPIGFEGSEWNLYEYCESEPISLQDPNGLKGNGSWPRPNRPVTVNHYQNKNKRCIFRLDPWERGTFGNIPTNGGEFIPQVTDPNEAARVIKDKGCCEVIIQGHQGASANPGGTSVKPFYHGQATPFFPSAAPSQDPIAQALKELRNNGTCKNCEIYLYARRMKLGDTGFAEQEAKRKALAKETGCSISGTRDTCNFRLPTMDDACTIDPDKWQPKQKGGPHVYIPTPFYKYPPTR